MGAHLKEHHLRPRRASWTPVGRLAAFAILGWLCGCAPTSKPILLQENPVPSSQEREWERYGAYYLTDELFVEASYLKNPVVNSAMSKYVVNKKLKILTRAGVEQGTVEVPFYASRLARKNLRACDSSGQDIKLDTAAIFREYDRSGKIIFPNVTPGCVLEIHLEFENQQPVTVFEHWFSGRLPVAHGRFTFSHLNKFSYDFADYGPIKTGNTQREKPAEDLEYKTWEVRNARPRERLDFQDEIDATEPRVSIVLRQFEGFPVITTWEKLSESYQEAALKPSFFNSSRKLKKKTEELAQGKQSDEEKAEAVFHWVQDNISYKYSGLGSIDPDRVMTSGQGNLWEMAVVLREMFKHLGLNTGVLVTRPRSMGGFDPKFETPLQLSVPLVTVDVGKRTLLAFPYARGAALGEYPEDYFGLSSLSLNEKDSAKVPDLAGDAAYTRSTYRIDAGSPEADQRLDLELGGYLAFVVRNALLQEKKDDVKDVFQKILTKLGTSNALKTCQITDLKARGKPMLAKLEFSNPAQTVERKGETQIKLSHLFPLFFTSYDTSRAAGFKNGLETEEMERIEVAKPAGRKLEANIPCEEVSNPLFRVTCRREETVTQYIFTRDLFIHKIKLNAVEIRNLYPQIVELNRISEARLILRGGDAEPAARTAKKRKPKPD
ncbi:MAG: transglutaminase domain-containing protein [Fibrobacteria bacterium]